MSTKVQPKNTPTPATQQLSHCPPDTIHEMYMQLGYLRGTGYEHAARITELFNKIINTYTSPTEAATS